MPTESSIETLARLVEDERDRIVRLWAKRLRTELHEVEVAGRDIRAPLTPLVDELVRLLRDRQNDAVVLWSEAVRPHAAKRYGQRFEAEDLARELKVLQDVLLTVWSRKHGSVPPEVALFISDLIGEGQAGLQGAYTRLLRTEEVRFREAAVMESVLLHVDVGILLAETDGTLSFATPPAAKLLGVPVRVLVGNRSRESLAAVLAQIQATHPNATPFKVQDMPFVRVLHDRLPVRNVRMKLQRPDGEEVILEMNATPLWEEGPEPEMVGVIQTLTDRTQEVRQLRELMGAHEELRRLQGQLLQRTRTQALGQLASGAAHALNNFLNVIRLRITLLRREFKPEHLDALDKTVRNIGDLVARLQEFSVQRGEEEVAAVDYPATVRQAIELVKGELERPEEPVELVVDLEEAEGAVRADPGYLRELVVNLVLAARDRIVSEEKPHPPGEPLGRIEVRAWREGEVHVLRIQDSARPYDPEEAARLFDPLKGKSKSPQLSLLLAVARNQVQRWGGELVPEVGEQTAFVVRLPVAEAEAVEPEEAPHERVTPPGPRRFQLTRRVLVVDDEPDNARMLAEVLSDEGYKVDVANSGEAALQRWATGRYDAALLDGLMPDMSGWELARRIRETSPQVLLAMVTGADVRGQNRASLALVDAVFRKPIDLAALDDFLSQRDFPPAGTEAPAPS